MTNDPLDEKRITELLDALERFGGDHLMFAAAVNQVRYGGHGSASASPLGPDAVRLGDDLDRLQMIWVMTGSEFQPGGGGVGAAFASFDLLARAWAAGAGTGPADEEAGNPERMETAIQAEAAMVRMTAGMSPPGTVNLFGTFTRDEMSAVAAHAERVAAALAPERSGAGMELFAEHQARMAGLAHIHEGEPDAREWLRANGQEAPLAANRFDAEDALAFVDELYAAGAERVVIASESIVEDEHEMSQGGPYADTLKVQLPADPSRRAAIFAIADREARSEGFDPEPDSGQDVIVFWWD